MSELTLARVHEEGLKTLRPPGRSYSLLILFLAAGIGWGLFAWVYQTRLGMGVAGINHPVGWGFYIANFVFWVGLAHSGTLISAILRLVRARWRNAISRASEAMTVFAVMTAALFPLFHLGRMWVFYYILPYPTQRNIYPSFASPLVLDVVAVLTYLTVSMIFFYVGLIPDLAGIRDRAETEHGRQSRRARVYRAVALGWAGAGSQRRHYERAYLYFAALATPLVISVHSIVSWDFAVSILPGWHETLFAPYFVAGAIHSGLAMVLVLLIPLRWIFQLEDSITRDHLELIAKTLLVTTAFMTYSYLIEIFSSLYSGNPVNLQFSHWRMTGWPAWIYWPLYPLNLLAPGLLVLRRVRRHIGWLLAIGLLVVFGMWLERVMIVTTSTAHDFMPHAWGSYLPTWVELSIQFAAAAFFLLWFVAFAKHLPVIAFNEIKGELTEDRVARKNGARLAERRERRSGGSAKLRAPGGRRPAMVMSFVDPAALLWALRRACQAGFTSIETFTPVHLEAIEKIMGRKQSPVRFWTLLGALLGLFAGLALAIGTAAFNRLMVGGKPIASIIPLLLVGFEGLILGGSIANLCALIVHARLGRSKLFDGYDPSFGRDRYGLVVAADAWQWQGLEDIARDAGAEEVRVLR